MDNAQYQLDLGALAGAPELGWQEADHFDGGSPLGLHDTTLFDQNGSELGGELYDPATGLRYDNSTYTGFEDLQTLETAQRPQARRVLTEDVLPPLRETKDAAARWLAEHELKLIAVQEDASQEAA